MANNNTPLWNKFTQIFKSDSFLSNFRSMALARDLLDWLPRDPLQPSDKPAELKQQINAAIAEREDNGNFSDEIVVNHFVDYLLNNQPSDYEFMLKGLGIDLIADIMEHPQYKLIDAKTRRQFETTLNGVYGYQNVTSSCENNVEAYPSIVLNENDYRRLINASTSLNKTEKNNANQIVDQALTDFDQEYTNNADLNKLREGIQYYGHDVNPQKNFLGKMRASYEAWLGGERAKDISNFNEQTAHAFKEPGQKNAALIAQSVVHDELVAAVLTRKGEKVENFQKAFIGSEIDGSTKKNPSFGVQLARTFGMGVVSSFAVGAAKNIPVIGKYVGGLLMAKSVLQKGYNELKEAKAAAKSQGRELGARDAVRVAVKTAVAVTPYVANMAASLIADTSITGRVVVTGLRSIGGIAMGVRAYMADINAKKSHLKINEKLTLKDHAKSILKAGAKAAATVGGSMLGAQLGNAFGQNLFASETMGAVAVTAQEEMQPEEIEAVEGVEQEVINDVNLPNSNITADEAALKELQGHEYELTDHARATANPDNDRMYQLDNDSNTYTQQDWYDINQYNRACEVLREAGVSDPDGALRNLAGANQFLGGKYGDSLNNLFNGNLTTEDVHNILEADKLLDETGDLIRDVSYQVEENSVAAEPVTTEPVVEETVAAETMPNYEMHNVTEPVVNVENVHVINAELMPDASESRTESMVTENESGGWTAAAGQFAASSEPLPSNEIHETVSTNIEFGPVNEMPDVQAHNTIENEEINATEMPNLNHHDNFVKEVNPATETTSEIEKNN